MTAEKIGQALYSCIRGSPADGVAQVNALYNSKDVDGDTFLWHFWAAVITAARGLSPGNSELTTLVTLLAELVNTNVDTVEDQAIWTSRRGLSMALRENVDAMLENAGCAALYARLASANIWDTLDFGALALRETLEEPAGMESPRLSERLAVLLAWVVNCGQLLYRGDTARQQSRLMLPGSLWNGPGGLNSGRWEFWKKQLQILSTDKSEASAIIAAMNESEQ